MMNVDGGIRACITNRDDETFFCCVLTDLFIYFHLLEEDFSDLINKLMDKILQDNDLRKLVFIKKANDGCSFLTTLVSCKAFSFTNASTKKTSRNFHLAKKLLKEVKTKEELSGFINEFNTGSKWTRWVSRELKIRNNFLDWLIYQKWPIARDVVQKILNFSDEELIKEMMGSWRVKKFVKENNMLKKDV